MYETTPEDAAKLAAARDLHKGNSLKSFGKAIVSIVGVAGACALTGGAALPGALYSVYQAGKGMSEAKTAKSAKNPDDYEFKPDGKLRRR